MTFLGATTDEDLVNTTIGEISGLLDDAGLVEERLVFVGLDGPGKTLRRRRFDSSPEDLVDDIDSVYLCQTRVLDGQPLRFCIVDVATTDSELTSGRPTRALVCRGVDFESIYSALRMGGRGGVVWRGSAVEDDKPFRSLNLNEYVFPNGFVDRLINQTISFLNGSAAAQLRQWGEPAKRGVLLFGPPGNGKTILTRICAKEALMAGMNVVIIEGRRRSIVTYDRDVMGIGDELRRAVSRGPSLLILEDIDLYCPQRPESAEDPLPRREDRALEEIKDFLSGVEPTEGYVMLATTNYVDRLDPALRRTGRLDLEIEVGPPSPEQREAALRLMIRNGPQPYPDVSAAAALLPNASFSDLAEVARRYKIVAARASDGDPSHFLTPAARDLALERGLIKTAESTSPATG